ncbi:DUF6653 family protein [Haladaptatus sp. CMSO5]|uniref:DUF6653 family protein n=1 Tax=Haladaptatus sp. CMSO5 TaxID=3120514 RepID=UPI002FCE4DE1
MDDANDSVHTILPDSVWKRHANPWSGWTRAATTPALVYALYQRNWRLVAGLVVWLIINPAAFRPPETTDAWMTRGVLAERAWLAQGHGTVGLSWPNVLNLLNVPATAYLGWATLRRRPVHAVLATALVMAFKLAWMAQIIDLTGIAPGEPFPDE